MNISISTLVSIAGTLGALYLFAAPIASKALAGEIQEQIQPMSDAFAIILLQNIQNQRNAVTAMQFKRDQSPGTWTLRDAQDLDAARTTLLAMERALDGMQAKK